MIALTRPSRVLAALALTGALAALALTSATQNASSADAYYRTCSMSDSLKRAPGTLRPSYHLTLKKKNTSCDTAKQVMKSFHKCRARLSVNCGEKVRSHWTCSGVRTANSPGSFDGRFVCSWGNRRVRSTYQQFKD